MSYVWAFGDGEAAEGATATHVFIATGDTKVFTVTLTVTDNNGARAEATQSIEVRAGDAGDGGGADGSLLPTAWFSADPFIGVAPLSVTFDARESAPGTGSIVAYNWDFGDDKQGKGSEIGHVFDPTRTTRFTVTLFVWNDSNQVDAAQIEIVVIVPEDDPEDDPPVADLVVGEPVDLYESDQRPTVPSLFEVTFDPRSSYADAGHSIEYWAWEFGDGDMRVETSDVQLTHIYELRSPSHTYTAKLTVFDDQGLEDSAVVNITLAHEEE